MSICGANRPCCTPSNVCPDPFGCPPNVCPDFQIKRHDTLPPFRVSVNDCNGPLDLTGAIAEASMWAKGRLKKAITATDTSFALADDIGFFQANVGDVIVIERIRNPEQLLVTGFDEDLKLIQVQRGYNGTVAGKYVKGQRLKIFRVLNGVAETHTALEDIPQLDGSVLKDVVTDSLLVYNWLPQDTCLPGCFWLEFKLLKMFDPPGSLDALPDIIPLKHCVSTVSTISVLPSTVPSFVPTVSGCEIGMGVDWVRRFPVEGEGFLIQILDSPTAETVT